jgi:uncharacterized membrane protein
MNNKEKSQIGEKNNEGKIDWGKVLPTSFLAATISVLLWTIVYIIEPILTLFLIIIIPTTIILTSIIGFFIIITFIRYNKRNNILLFLVFNVIFTIIYWFIFTSQNSIIIKLANQLKF